MLNHLALAILFAFAFIMPATAEDSIWFDADGEPHYIGSDNDGLPSLGTSRKNKKQPVTAKVDLYITSWCPFCKKAIIFLRENNIAFNEYDIEMDMTAADRKAKLAPDYSGVPLAVINGEVIRGFSEFKYRRALAKPSN